MQKNIIFFVMLFVSLLIISFPSLSIAGKLYLNEKLPSTEQIQGYLDQHLSGYTFVGYHKLTENSYNIYMIYANLKTCESLSLLRLEHFAWLIGGVLLVL